jgi:ankyrin repeat protein
MAETRAIRTDPDQKNLTYVEGLSYPLEIWSMIFQHLEPSFLNSVLRTCFSFNELVSSNLIAYPLLNRFYPTAQLTANLSSFSLFKQLYSENNEGLSRPARTLRDLCLYHDLAQIEKFTFEPDILFEIDKNQETVLAHINRLNRQDIRDLLFKKIHTWFEMNAKNKDWWDALPISLLLHSYPDSKTYRYQTNKKFILMDFAVTLNQLAFIKQNDVLFTETDRPHSENRSYFDTACLYGHLSIVKYILIRGLPNNHFNRKSLAQAVIGNQEEVVEFLLITHSNYITPGMITNAAYHAAKDDRLAILELLLMHVTDIRQCQYGDNDTLLNLACKSGQLNAAKLIVNLFPELLDDDEEFDSYVSDAAEAGCHEIIEFLMSYEEDIPTYISNYSYLLLDASASGNANTVTYLLDIGAQINGVNDKGEAAIHVATLQNHLPVVKVLVQRGADMRLTNGSGKTALDLARTNEDNSIALYLMDEQYKRGRKRKAEAAPNVEGVQQPEQTRARL